MSVAYPPELQPKSRNDDETVELFACERPDRVSGRPVLNEFGSGFALKQDASTGGPHRLKIVWVGRTK